MWLIAPFPVHLMLWSEKDPGLLEIWMQLNGVILLCQFGWGLRHPGVLWKARGTILRWSLWAALLVAVPITQWIDKGTFSLPLPTGVIYLLLLLLVFPLGFVLGGVVGVAAAGNGILASASEDRTASARSGVRWCWVFLLALAVGSFISPGGSRSIKVLLIGLPWLAVCLQPFMAQRRRFGIVGRLDLWLARRLRWSVFGRSLDLRAHFFSTVGFLVAWALIGTKIFAMLQASFLVSNIQVMEFFWTEPRSQSKEIVILDWDSASRRAAMSGESEAVSQARLLQRLSGLGVRRIVMSAPDQLNSQTAPSPDSGGSLQANDLRIRELDALAEAMRAAGNVLLLAPDWNPALEGLPEQAPSPLADPFAGLRNAAVEVASPWLPNFRSSALPMIPFRWKSGEPAPAPLALFKAVHPEGSPSTPQLLPDGTANLGGRSFPLIDRQGNLLVLSNFSDQAFPKVNCSDVLRGEWLLQAGERDRPEKWVPPEEFFRDKIVFIPPQWNASRPGPFGPVQPTLLLAHATQALMGNRFIRTLSPLAEIGIALTCALVVGSLAMRRDPLKAGWRLMLVVGGILFSCLVLFAYEIWLDPFLPVTSSVAAFLLVAQLSFSLERAAKDRNRSLLHRFVDPLIARELLDSAESRIGLGGNRENVVILFADVRGFSRFAESHPPEEVMRVVNDYLGVMTDVLHAHGGLLDKYTGDGLMAMFRIDRAGSTAEAVEAALAMRNAVLELSRNRTDEGDNPLGVGISIHAGEAVVGLIGNSEHQVNFTAFGHTVVVAARLQAVADAGEVIVSEAVNEMIRGCFETLPRPAMLVKGVSGPVQPHLVLGPKRS